MKRNPCVMALLTVLVTGGCVTRVPHTGVGDDSAAKTFRTTPNMTNLYINRERMFYGSRVGWDVGLDGRVFGVLTIGSYVFRAVEPGRHILSRLQSAQEIQLAAGRNYFFSFAPSFSESMTKFVEVPEQQGRAAVAKLPRVTTLY